MTLRVHTARVSCTDPARCHRTVLASILAKLGAINEGERHG